MSNRRISLNQSLWICGGFIEKNNRHACGEIAALRERGAAVFLLKSHNDRDGLEELRRLLRQDNRHVILMWLHPREMAALQPLFRERKNFSVVLDDWWIIPHWFVREAEYKIFRKYNGIAVRLGAAQFINDAPPLWSMPAPISDYSLISSVLRLPALAASPLFDCYKWFQRRDEKIDPEKFILFPFTAVADWLPVKSEKIEYDFGITGSTYGVWTTRDPFVSSKYTFANLYYDRQRLMDFTGKYKGNPFKIWDWRTERKEKSVMGWEEYLQRTAQCRFVVSSGGLHEAAVPKFMEYACIGTPMIGRKLPFEYPWLDDCVFPVDIMHLSPSQLKPLLHRAIDCHAAMREKCLNLREKIFKLYDVHQLLDMVQAQIGGQPIPADYLTEKGIACERMRANMQK